MSDLWAQFSLNLYNASEAYSTPLTPLNDNSNSVQVIDGQAYLLQISTRIAASFLATGLASPQPGEGVTQTLSSSANGQTLPDQSYRSWTSSVSVQPVSATFDPTALNNITPVLLGYESFPNTVLENYQYGGSPSNEVLQNLNYTLLTLGPVLQTAIEPNGVPPASYLTNFFGQPVPQSFSQTYGITSFGPETVNSVVYYPQYVWVDLGPAPSTTVSIGTDFANTGTATASSTGLVPITFTISLSTPVVGDGTLVLDLIPNAPLSSLTYKNSEFNTDWQLTPDGTPQATVTITAADGLSKTVTVWADPQTLIAPTEHFSIGIQVDPSSSTAGQQFTIPAAGAVAEGSILSNNVPATHVNVQLTIEPGFDPTIASYLEQDVQAAADRISLALISQGYEGLQHLSIDIQPTALAGSIAAQTTPSDVNLANPGGQGPRTVARALADYVTGHDPGPPTPSAPVAEMTIQLDPSKLTSYFDGSADLTNTTVSPADSLDFITVLSHEILHGLGLGDTNQGTPWIVLASSGQFVGDNAEQIFGGPVPLTADLQHLGGLLAPADLMGVGATVLPHTGISGLDAAMLADLADQLLAPTGKVSDGNISGATVYADANGTGQLAANDVSTTTNSTGSFSLAGGSGPLIAFGGTDISTGLPFKGQMSAPEGSSVITPLTTLLTALAAVRAAESTLLSALGLSSTLNLTTFDPIAAAQGGSADGAATEIAGEKVYDTVEMIASALAGAGGAFTASLQAAFSALASALDGAGINLGDKTALSALTTQVAHTESLTLGNDVADTIASIIAAGNTALDHVLQTDQPGAQLLSDAAGVELVMQGAASTALTNAGLDLPKLQGIADLFTGTNLSELISQAQAETQNPGQDLGPVAFDGSASTDQNTVLNGTVSAVDLAGHSITYAIDGTTPAGLTFNPDGTFKFAPGSAYKYLGVGESTSLSFQFTASDGEGTDSTARETITINGLNDNPTAMPDSNGVAKGNKISVSAAHGVLANDSDPDIHDQLAVGSVNGSAANVGHSVQGTYGTLTLNADGSYSYSETAKALPSQTFAQDNFTYATVDGHGGSATSTLTFVVFDPSASYQAGSNTTLSGGNGKSVLDGSAGHDPVLGGNGPDVLIGGNGDTMTGGNGPDQFVFRPNFGANIITDFDVKNENIQFDKSIFASVGDILSHTADSAHGAIISDGHGDTVTLTGVTLAQIQAHQSDLHLV